MYRLISFDITPMRWKLFRVAAMTVLYLYFRKKLGGPISPDRYFNRCDYRLVSGQGKVRRVDRRIASTHQTVPRMY